MYAYIFLIKQITQTLSKSHKAFRLVYKVYIWNKHQQYNQAGYCLNCCG